MKNYEITFKVYTLEQKIYLHKSFLVYWPIQNLDIYLSISDII